MLEADIKSNPFHFKFYFERLRSNENVWQCLEIENVKSKQYLTIIEQRRITIDSEFNDTISLNAQPLLEVNNRKSVIEFKCSGIKSLAFDNQSDELTFELNSNKITEYLKSVLERNYRLLPGSKTAIEFIQNALTISDSFQADLVPSEIEKQFKKFFDELGCS